MKIEQKVELLRKWQTAMLALEGQTDQLFKLTGGYDGTLSEAIGAIQGGYTSAIAQLVGDSPRDNWLEWYWIECDLGRAPKEAGPTTGSMILVDSVEKLAGMIG